jgi:hypothetical protein
LWLDERLILVSSFPVQPTARTMVVLAGANAFDGRMELGPVEIWAGVRGGPAAVAGAPGPAAPTDGAPHTARNLP